MLIKTLSIIQRDDALIFYEIPLFLPKRYTVSAQHPLLQLYKCYLHCDGEKYNCKLRKGV